MKTAGKIFLCGLVLLFARIAPATAGEIEFTFNSTFDNSAQLSAAYVPEKAGDSARPLLVVAHYWSGDRHTARVLGYYEECEKRGWLLVCPELHGRRVDGRTSLAALEAQHDVIDAVGYMERHFKVDASRIYLTGRSMGGMLAQMMAAKYPDLFAAVMAGQGISDLRQWIIDSPGFKESVEKECGVYGPEASFEYARRSSVNYAPNMKYVPLLLWHGTNDTVVPPENSEKLYQQIKKYNPFQTPVYWLQGAPHSAANFSPAWECRKLEVFQNVSEGGVNVPRFYPELRLVTDEAKEYFWLKITPKSKDRFGRVSAGIQKGVLTIDAANLAEVSVDTEKIARDCKFTRYMVTTDTAMVLKITRGDAILDTAQIRRKRSGKFLF